MERADGDLASFEELLSRITSSIRTKWAEVELLREMLDNARRSITEHEREEASLRALIERLRAGEADQRATGPNVSTFNSTSSAMSAFLHRDSMDGPVRRPASPAPEARSAVKADSTEELREPTGEELRRSIHALEPKDLVALGTALDAHFGRTGDAVRVPNGCDLKPGRNGRAPRGFGNAVRSIARRDIAAAAKPLRRAEIVSAVKGSGIPVPAKNLAQKVSKALVNDPDLVNIRGKGYWFRRDVDRPGGPTQLGD